ncbi:hypothetical protein EsVE80_05190 [Enterococcus saigonensis]|uniref:MapZ extracellular domain-containing protein n=1 Tax=Enterococcus saigonensis TaxID=1805431 RepID=A0A679IIN0_9ENTE|nr:hypothetical protein [Enterococcus saigonensis]BCA84996.1 hypothetical protein EsVE80_05190 [Enterococcus saigonensis]
MGNPLIKTIAVAAVGIGAVAICFVGYRENNNKQYQQKVSYAETAVKKDEASINEVNSAITALYTSKEKVFLKRGITEAELTQTGAKLDGIKVSADDFGIEENDLPKNMKKIAKEKEVLNKQMADAEAKFAIQNNVDTLFEKPVSNWQKAQNNVVIKTKLKDTDVGTIRERVSFIDESDWTKLVKEYLSYADAQLKRVAEINKSLESMLKDDKITNKATYEKYLSLVNSISQVRNKNLKEEFTEKADKISEQLGLGTTGYNDNATSDAASYSDEATQANDASNYQSEASDTEAGDSYSETGY